MDYNDYKMAKSQKSFSPRRFTAQQNSQTVLPYNQGE